MPDAPIEDVDSAAASRIIDDILLAAISGGDLGAIVGTVCRALVAAGIPLRRATLGMPAIDPTVRGLNWIWWRQGDETSETAATIADAILDQLPHGAATEATLRAGPIPFMLNAGHTIQRWRLDTPDEIPFPLFERLQRRGITEVAIRLVPFKSGASALIGVAFSIATDRPGGFSEPAMALVDRVVAALALAAYRIALDRITVSAFGAYLGDATGRRVLAGEIRRGEGHTIRAAVLLADLSGFTALTEHAAPMDVVALLNEHFEAMGEPILERGGEILKYLGDGLLAVFPVADEASFDAEIAACLKTLAAASDARARTALLNDQRAEAGLPTLELDLALHFGEVVYGNIGTTRRLDFTVIGRAVNEASRMEKLCDDLGRHLVLSAEFARRCAGRNLVGLGRHMLRGVGERDLFAPE
ncbi:MAG TPA: adenylate/guanylate cyclase domain-containing protein [Stellaceae bacterium]|nr:adenylate/guanylate cyclase domain-containing protein [Stellaceae bacterium]